jgi:hypothetical protein
VGFESMDVEILEMLSGVRSTSHVGVYKWVVG